MPLQLGVDLGGTKIAAVVLGADGRVAWEDRLATPRDDYAGTIEAIASLVDAGERAAGAACTVGIGMPGAISPATGLVKNANSVWLNGRALHHDLEARLARPVRLANDANCLAVSEASDGAAAGAHMVFGVILGTGCGGGIALGGHAHLGANAIAGEWGHNPLPWPQDDERPGPPCYCGRSGCLETFVSGPGLAAAHERRTGTRLSGEAIAAAAGAGDAAASETIDAWLDRLARGLATIINVLDPDVIVVGGGLSRIARLYSDVPELWRRWVFSDRVDTRVLPALHGDASGVRGAARLWARPS
jgi:fructokinase